MGAVTAAGWGVDAFRTCIRSGQTAIGQLTRFLHAEQRTHLAGQVPEAPPGQPQSRWRRLSYSDRFALFATLEALDQAGLPDTLEAMRAGVFFGSSTGGLFETELFYEQLVTDSRSGEDRSLLASHQLSAPAETVARRVRIRGPVETISSACASASLALEQGLNAIRLGEVDIVITGGADCLSVTTYSGFNALRAMDERPCRPFGRHRAGMSLGEGGAVLILEALSHADARGARPLAEVLGAGSTCDASHMTAPCESGEFAAGAIAAALDDAGLTPEAIDSVNVHGTGTPLNDAAEFNAMQRVLGARLTNTPITATKSVVGHLLGAAGAIEAIASVLSLQDAEVQPTAGPTDPDPQLPVDMVRQAPRGLTGLQRVLSSNLGFGGANAALVFGRWPAS